MFGLETIYPILKYPTFINIVEILVFVLTIIFQKALLNSKLFLQLVLPGL